MKKALTVAVSLALSAPVYAGDLAIESNGKTTEPLSSVSAVAHDKIEGMSVYDNSGEKVGDVDRVVNHAGQRTVIIGIDGALGDGAKEIAVPFSSLSLTANHSRIVVDRPAAALRALPDVDPGDFTALGTDPHDPSAHALEGERAHSQDLEGKAVYSTNGRKVGDIDRVVMSNGKRTAIIGIDGIIGDGAKEVAVPLSRVTRSVDGDRVTVDYSESELKALPDVDPGDFVSLRM